MYNIIQCNIIYYNFMLYHHLLQYFIVFYDIHCKNHRMQYPIYIIVLMNIVYLIIRYEMNIEHLFNGMEPVNVISLFRPHRFKPTCVNKIMKI